MNLSHRVAPFYFVILWQYNSVLIHILNHMLELTLIFIFKSMQGLALNIKVNFWQFVIVPFITSHANCLKLIFETISQNDDQTRCELSVFFFFFFGQKKVLIDSFILGGVGWLTGWHCARCWQREPWVPGTGEDGLRSAWWCGEEGGWAEGREEGMEGRVYAAIEV